MNIQPIQPRQDLARPNARGGLTRRVSSRRGFTLMEVLVSIALLAIVIPVAMSATAQALRTADSAKHRSQAAALGESKMAELVVDPNIASAALSGNFGPDFPEYQWQGIIDNWSEGTTQMQQLQINVSWGVPGQPSGSVTLSTLFIPPSTDTGETP